LRDVKPAWGLPARVELRVREIRLRLALHQVPQAVELLRELVLRPGEGRTAVFQLAREYLARDEQTSALVLARELTRLLPDNAAAAKLFDEAQSSRLKAPVGLPAPAPASRPL
jgi:hypothetical protein